MKHGEAFLNPVIVLLPGTETLRLTIKVFHMKKDYVEVQVLEQKDKGNLRFFPNTIEFWNTT